MAGKKYLWLILPAVLAPRLALAHCPLCTAGAGVAAVFAAWLGVSMMSIGVFIGAFGIAIGLWIARLIKKQYIPHQAWVLAVISFATTVIPLMPLMQDYTSFYLSLGGEYGSLLNRTYVVNRFLVGSAIGGVVMALAPSLSARITALRKGSMFRFQGLSITFLLLVAILLIVELIL
jgi:hypothetical protein